MGALRGGYCVFFNLRALAFSLPVLDFVCHIKKGRESRGSIGRMLDLSESHSVDRDREDDEKRSESSGRRLSRSGESFV